MKSNIIIHLMLLLLLVGTTSCEKEIGEFKDYEDPQLVVNAMLTAGQDQQHISILKTGATQPVQVPGAQVCLSVNGNTYLQSDTLSEGGTLGLSCRDIKAGDRVDIEVSHKGLHASAHGIVPSPIEIVSVDTVKVMYSWGNEMWPHTRYLVKLRIPEELRNQGAQYFKVDFNYVTTSVSSCSYIFEDGQYIINRINYKTDTSNLFNYASDPALTESEDMRQNDDSFDIDWLQSGTPNDYHVFRSKYFKDGEYCLRLDVPRPYDYGWGWKEDVTIRVYTISQLEYYYLLALPNFNDFEFTIFDVEPIMPSNIDGGAGIFCLEAASEFKHSFDHGMLKLGDVKP